MGEHEIDFVTEAFKTNWIAPLGPNVDGFEEDLKQFTGSKHVAVLSSGTAAIHLSLIILGVKPGDLVLCQSLTFSATANPVSYLGATPVFVDSEQDTWNMCPRQLELAIKACMEGKVSSKPQKPKAIIPVHLYGMPAKMDEIMTIASRYEIPVIEDAAEALGSRINNRACGSFGLFGILSFNGNKIITTSGGGALLSDDGSLIQQAKFLATQARDPAAHYQHSQIGYNYRMSNVLAGIGRGQMQVMESRIEKRRSNYDFYIELLKETEGVTFLPELPGYFSNRWLTTILVDPLKTGGITRETVRLELEKANIESRPLWKPMHQQPVFSQSKFFGYGISDKLFENGLCLPSGSGLTTEDQNRIEQALKKVLRSC